MTLTLLALSLLTLALILTSCGSAATVGNTEDSRFQGLELEQPTAKPEFTLTDTAGQPFDFSGETEGKLTLMYFGYTYCPDICPVHLAQITSVLDRNPTLRERTQLVFVSVDPGRDSPEVIREYLDQYSTDYVGLVGTPQELAEAEKAVGVPPAIIGDTADPDYLVGHAAQVFAWAPDGLGYTVYPFGTRQSEWANDLELLVEIGDS